MLAQASCVFQTKMYWSAVASYRRELVPAVTTSSMPSSELPVPHATWRDDGEPAAKMSRPRSPPRLKRTGTAWTAFMVFTVGGESTGGANPENGQVVAATVQFRVAGEGSALPATSDAATDRACAPAARES